jgi:uncharacterized phosphosugar-binding protein
MNHTGIPPTGDAGYHELSARSFAEKAMAILEQVAASDTAPLIAAADLMVTCLANSGVVQAFGTGHSQAAALEIAGRAGGLIPTNRLALSDLVMYGNENPEVLADPLLERRPGLAAKLFALAAPAGNDLFVIVSNSGINSSIIEMAMEAKRTDHPLVAITSLAHTAAVASRHPSGQRLVDLADVVIDNGAPAGDSILPLAAGVKVCSVSSITTAFVIQMLIAEVAGRLRQRGIDVPAYESANVPGGHERNLELEGRYSGRIRRWAV